MTGLAKFSQEREALFERIEREAGIGEPRPEGAPLDWNDIGFICAGLTFATRPLHAATRAVTERHSLGPRGAWMLNLIASGAVYPNELSSALMISRSLVSAELARLAEAGLVESRTGASDRRRSELALTATGLAALDEIRDELARIITSALGKHPPDEVRRFAHMLLDLRGEFAQGTG